MVVNEEEHHSLLITVAAQTQQSHLKGNLHPLNYLFNRCNQAEKRYV